MKAWSQNLGHTDVLTTFTSYGMVPVHRYGELIRSLRAHALLLKPQTPDRSQHWKPHWLI